MYKKYIKKKGKRIGPYFYDSIRLADGKIKSVYLGNNLKDARAKLKRLKEEQKKTVKERSSQTLSVTLSTPSYAEERKTAHAFLFFFCFALLLSFALPSMSLLSQQQDNFQLLSGLSATIPQELEFSSSESNPITGYFIAPSKNTLEETQSHALSVLVNDSVQHSLSVSGIERLRSVALSGRIAATGENPSVKIFLSEINSGETFLVIDSEDLDDEGVLGLFKDITGFAVLPTFDTGITGFSVVDSFGSSIRYTINRTGTGTVFSFFNRLIFNVSASGLEEGLIKYEEYRPRGLIEPENVSFVEVFAFDLSETNFTNQSNASFAAEARADYLYGCYYWDFDLGICLSEWIYLLNLSDVQSYHANISYEVSAFAEGIFDPNKTSLDVGANYTNDTVLGSIPLSQIVEEKEDVLTTYLNETNQSNASIQTFSNLCGRACRLPSFEENMFLLKFFITNAVLELDQINLSVEKEAETVYSLDLLDEEGKSLLGKTVSTVVLSSETNASSFVTVVTGLPNLSYTRETTHFNAVVNAPVHWKKKVVLNTSVQGLAIEVPEGAMNVTVQAVKKSENTALFSPEVKHVMNDGSILDVPLEEETVIENENTNPLSGFVVAQDLSETEETTTNESVNESITLETSLTVPLGDGEVEETVGTELVLIEEDVKEVELSYQLPGPQAEITDIEKGKRVFVHSDVHYTNVLSYAEVPEVYSHHVQLERLISDPNNSEDGFSRVAHPFTAYDTNENGLIDLIEWVVPSLSNDTYEINLTVLNVQSYPIVGGQWNVRLDTMGSGDLWASTAENTTWNENYIEGDDVHFSSFKCGPNVVIGQWVAENKSYYFPNYNCSTLSTFTVDVYTPGRHALEFNFEGIVRNAYNDALLPWTVQRGRIDIPGGGGASVTATLEKPVNVSKAFLLYGSTGNFSVNAPDRAFWYGNITNATTVTFGRQDGFGLTNISWEVIEGPIDVQSGFDDVIFDTGRRNSTLINLSRDINVSRSIVLTYGTTNTGGVASHSHRFLRGSIVNESQINISRMNFSLNSDTFFTWFVIEFPPSFEVQSGTYELVNETGSLTLDPPVNDSRTWIYHNYFVNSSSSSGALIRADLINNTNLSFTRASGHPEFIPAYIQYYAVQFPEPTVVYRDTVEHAQHQREAYDNFPAVSNLSKTFSFVSNTYGQCCSPSSGIRSAFAWNLSNTSGIFMYRKQSGTESWGNLSWQVISLGESTANSIASVTMNAPANNTDFLVDSLTVVLNATIFDLDTSQTHLVRIFGGNESGVNRDWLLYYNDTVIDTEEVTYNWSTAPINESMVNLQLLYRFDLRDDGFGENATHVFDFSRNQRNGTLGVGSSFRSDGKIGRAVRLNGSYSTRVLSVANPSVLLGTNKTVAFWAKNNQSDEHQRIITMGSDYIRFNSNNNIIYRFTNGSGSGRFLQSGAVLSGHLENWTHYVIAYFANETTANVTFYINGEFFSSVQAVVGMQTPSGSSVDIASTSGGSEVFNGSLDEFAYINETFNASQIWDLYRLTVGRYYWHVNVTDGNDENISELYEFTVSEFNNHPYVILNAPANNSNFEVDNFTIILNASVFDFDADSLSVEIFGGNITTPDTSMLLYRNTSVSNGSEINYNWTSPITNASSRGLIALYHFDNRSIYGENDTHVFDFSGHGNNGTLSNAVQHNNTNAKFGGSVSFQHGFSGTIDMGSNAILDDLSSFTYAAWIYRAGNYSGGVLEIISKANNFQQTKSLGWGGVAPANFIDGHVRTNGTSAQSRSQGSLIVEGEWQFVAMTYNHSGDKSIRLYYNGDEISSYLIQTNATDTLTSEASSPLRVSGRGDVVVSSQLINLSVDEVSIWNTSLNASQIKDLYRLNAGRYYWHVNVTDNKNVNRSVMREIVIGNAAFNSAPYIDQIVANTTNPTLNSSSENVTAHANASDIDNETIKLIYTWLHNNVSYPRVYLPFEAGSDGSSTNDYSTYNLDGTVSGATYNETGGFDGGGAYEFDGINDYISVADIDQGDPNQTTIMLWFKANPGCGGNADVCYLVSKGQFSGQGAYTLTVNEFGNVSFTMNQTIVRTDVIGNDSQWHHVAAVRNGTNISVYVDGQIRGTRLVPVEDQAIRNDETTIIGSDDADPTFRPFNGTIDDVRIFNITLGRDQILAFYNNRTDLIHAGETEEGDSWRFRVTPNDGNGDGTTNESNEVIILGNSIPYITLNAPENDTNFTGLVPRNQQTAGNVTLDFTPYDFDGDLLELRFFLTNGTKGATVELDDLALYIEGIPNGTNLVATNVTTPVLDVDMFGVGSSLLLAHFDNRSEYDENDTHVMDFAGKFNGTKHGSGVINRTGGRMGGAFFNPGGAGNAVSFGEPTGVVGQGKTHIFWVRPTSTTIVSGGPRNYIYSKRSQPDGDGFAYGVNSGGDLFFRNDSATADLIISEVFPSNNTWYHFAIVFHENLTVQVFRNMEALLFTEIVVMNVSVEAPGVDVTLAGSGDLTKNEAWTGHIDEFAIFDAALNISQINDTFRLRSGTYHWYVRATDTGGFSNTSETRTFTIDRPPYVKSAAFDPTTINVTSSLNCTFVLADDLQSVIASTEIRFFNDSLQHNATVTLTNLDVETMYNKSIGDFTVNPKAQKHFQNWSCGVTPIDNFSTGPQGNTTAYEVVNLAPDTGVDVPTAGHGPISGILSNIRTPNFTWSPRNFCNTLPLHNNETCETDGSLCYRYTSDCDLDNVTHYINITCINAAGGSCDDHHHIAIVENVTYCDFESTDSSSNGFVDLQDMCKYVLPFELRFFDDDNYFYNWTIIAEDIYNQSPEYTPHVQYNVSAYVALGFTDFLTAGFNNAPNTVQFGSRTIHERKDTFDCNSTEPCPIQIENIGNVEYDINLTAMSGLWLSTTSNIDNYALRFGNGSGGGGFNESGSNTSWFNLFGFDGGQIRMINIFNHSPANNTLRIDADITVPPQEVPGNLSATVTLLAWYCFDNCNASE